MNLYTVMRKLFYTTSSVVSYVLTNTVLLTALLLFVYFALYQETTRHDKYGYPCEIAEISPDVPIPVKEECRKLRAKGITQHTVYYPPKL